jgi:hypothetical protein
MLAGRLLGITGLVLVVLSSPVEGQRMEAELGVLGGYGFNDLYGLGLGVTGGVLIGDLYVGGRFVDHFGTSTDVRRGSQINTTELGTLIFAADVGYRLVGETLDFRLFANVGVAHYRQDIIEQPDMGTATETTQTSTELLVTPGAVVILPLQGFKLGVEVQYLNAGDPAFSEAVNTRAFAAYARIIIPLKG